MTLLTVGAVGGWVGVMASDRELPTEVYEARVLPGAARAGDRIEIEFQAIRRRSCRLHVVRYVYDSHGVRHVLGDLDFPPGSLPVGTETYRVQIDVPVRAAPGPATYRSVNSFACNGLQLLWPMTDAREAKFTIDE